MTKIDSAVQWATKIANDNSHGYSQINRWGSPDYDCSSLVISAWQQAGVPVKTNGATYTGNMKSVFLRCGFEDVTNQVSLTSGSGVQKGDVLLNIVNHTAMSIGNGQIVHARTNEGNSQSGDQSGNEIRVQKYFNYPWDCVLRFKDGGAPSSTASTSSTQKAPQPQKTTSQNPTRLLRYGNKGDDVKFVQQLLIDNGFNCGPSGADGDFGINTRNAVIKCQRVNNLEVDGIVGPLTLAALTKVK